MVRFFDFWFLLRVAAEGSNATGKMPMIVTSFEGAQWDLVN